MKAPFFALIIAVLSLSPAVRGQTTFTFSTPANSMVTDGAVSASATFVVSAGQVVITLKDLLSDPKSAGQLVSDLEFKLSGIMGSTTLSSSFAQQITINGNHSVTPGTTGSTGWGLGTFNSGLILCTICPMNSGISGAGPAGEIIGPGPYPHANSSIAGNGPHNPFLKETATFTITNSSITAGTLVSSAIFSFGTTFGSDVTGVSTPSPSPEPATLILFGTGLLFLAKVARRGFWP